MEEKDTKQNQENPEIQEDQEIQESRENLKSQENQENQEGLENQENLETVTDLKGLNLDYSVLGERNTSSYMSLTDLYQLSVFTNDFDEKVKNYENKKSQKYNDLHQQMFVNEMNGLTDPYGELMNNMFTEGSAKILKGNNSNSARQNRIVYYMVGGIVFMLFLLALVQYYIHKRKESLAHVNDFDDKIIQN